MSIREEFRIETGDVRQDLKKIEDEVAASAKRQGDTLASEGKKAGEQQAAEIVKGLRTTFRARQGQLKQELAAGVIDKKAFRQASEEAKKSFNAGILKALDDLTKKGETSAETMDRLRNSLKAVGREGNKAGEETKSAWERVKGTLFRVKTVIAGVAAFLVGRALKGFFASTVAEAEQASKSWARLEANVQATGQSYEQVRPEIEATARAIQSSTRFGDEQVADALSELISLTGDYRSAMNALGTTMDLAIAKDMDLETAARLLGRAIIGDTSQLKRYGIVVAEGADAMESIRTQFAGAAEVDGRKLSARLARLRNEWGDIKEAIGNAISGGAGATDALGGLADMLVRLHGWIQNNSAQLSLFAQKAIEAAGAAGRFIGTVLDIWDPAGQQARIEIEGIARMGFDERGLQARLAVEQRNLEALQKLKREQTSEVARVEAAAREARDAGVRGAGGSLGQLRDTLEQTRQEVEAAGLVIAFINNQLKVAEAGKITGAGPRNVGPEDTAAERARGLLAQRLQEFGLAQRVGLTGLGDAEKLPHLLETARAQLQEVLRLDKEIADLEEKKASATKDQAGELERVLGALRAQRAAADMGATLSIRRQAELSGQGGFVTGVLAGRGTPNIFAGQRPQFDPIIQQMQRVASAVDDVTAAERELTRAQIEQDQVGAKAATEALTAAKEQLRARVAEVAKVLRGLIKDEEKLAKVQEELAGILDEAGVGDGKQAKDWDQIASSVEGVARGVLATADAMGVLDEQSRKVLQGVVDLAAGFGRLGTDPIGGAFQILGGGISLLSGLFGGRGEDDASRKAAEDLAQQMREQARQLRENTEALREFAARALSGVTPADYNQLVSQGTALWDFLRRGLDPYDVWLKYSQMGVGQQSLGLAAKDLGMTESELAGLLEAIEKLTGVEFFGDEGISSYAEFFRALEALRGKDLSAFGEDLGGRLDALGFILRAMGDDAGTAEEQLQRFLDILRSVPEAVGFADALEKMVKDQGPEAAKAWLQGLAEMLGREGVTEELLGIFGAGLTAEEIGRAIEEALKFVSGAGVDASFSRSTQIARTITDIQANEVVAWLSELTATSHEQLVELQGIHEILAQSFAGALPAPSGAAALVAGGGASLSVGTVNMYGRLTDGDFRQIWQRLGEEVLLRSKGRVS